MPALSWNEIRQRAIQFARDWEAARHERAEAQTFWNEFFQVFGVKRRTVASFEEPVRSLKDTYQRIDLFWKGRLLAEHKSAGESLDKAQSQAFDYIQLLASSGRQEECPRYVILSNFQRIALYDLEPEEQMELPLWEGRRYEHIEFPLRDLSRHLRNFAFFLGQKIHRFGEEDPANIKAAEIMAGLHDAIQDDGYDAESLERLLVRLLFCLFADDTGIFEPAQFELFIENRTRSDASDLGSQLNALFDVLNTPKGKRSKSLDEDLAAFEYINGDLFAERLPLAGFNRKMRDRLIAASHFDWSRISPAVFGSLFQAVMDARERRQIGAHYTSERDILKLIRPLFLDELREEFEKIKKDRARGRADRLHEFQQRLARLRFLDPACGCGNFLVITYRELRELELEVLNLLFDFNEQKEAFSQDELAKLSQVDVDQFFGIEIGEWPARIAETALWLTDHQMNVKLSQATGNIFQRIPLRKSPRIRLANALRLDWNQVLPAKECSFVLGNPPFVGAKFQTSDQKADTELVAKNVENAGLLDYVTLWYFKAMGYVAKHDIRCAFVSTNSVSQGEQVGILWRELFARGAKIHFAHRTFSWQSEAKGKAHVHVVIIGFGRSDRHPKRIYEYHENGGEPVVTFVSNINPYLVEGRDVLILNRSTPLCDVPEIGIGNKPIDGGHYLFTEQEKAAFLRIEPGARKFFRPWIGSDEFLNGYQRWCLWLGEAAPGELKQLPECRKRIEKVKAYRLASRSPQTRELAEIPRRFHVENFPQGNFLVIPEVSSEKRPYIPIGYLAPPVICSNLVKIIPDANLYHFGVLSSEMHMAWVRQACGRLKSDFRYSVRLVYNNFPWPKKPTAIQRKAVADCAKALLKIRKKYLGLSNLAQLYDPLCIPGDLLKAHKTLDRTVDRCYRAEKFRSDRDRIEFLFNLYEEFSTPLANGVPIE